MRGVRPRASQRPFYGWVIVAALSTAGGVSMFMGAGNFGLFVAPMSAELGIGNGYFGWALSARLLGFALSGPILGRLIDRHGSRVLLAVGGILFGLSAMALGLVETGWQMLGLTLLAGVTGFWGSSTLYLSIPIAKWFVRQRGRAMSLYFMGIPLGIGLASPLTQLLIDAVGWRNAWFVVGAAGGILVAAISLLFVRNTPADLGLFPDGDDDEPGAPAAAGGGGRPEHPWTVREAMRTGAFWRISLAYGLLMAAMGSIGVFWVPFLQGLDVHSQVAALAFATQAFTQVATGGLIAPWIDRANPRYVAMAGFACVAAAMLVAAGATGAWHGFAGAVLAGVGLGCGMLMQAHIWPSYFGRAHIGAIRGAATPLTIAMTAAGAPVLGVLFDSAGFTAGWLAAAGGLAAGLVLLLLSPKPAVRSAPA